MWTIDEHVDDLVRHIGKVRDACLLLGKRIIDRGDLGDEEFGRNLIARGFVHDSGKFTGIQWKYLHVGPDVPKPLLDLAVHDHVHTHDHHAEFFGGIKFMPRIAVAEMVCDWLARSQEFADNLRDWIDEQAVQKYQIDKSWPQWEWIQEFLNLLLKRAFVNTEVV